MTEILSGFFSQTSIDNVANADIKADMLRFEKLKQFTTSLDEAEVEVIINPSVPDSLTCVASVEKRLNEAERS